MSLSSLSHCFHITRAALSSFTNQFGNNVISLNRGDTIINPTYQSISVTNIWTSCRNNYRENQPSRSHLLLVKTLNTCVQSDDQDQSQRDIGHFIASFILSWDLVIQSTIVASWIHNKYASTSTRGYPSFVY